MGSRAKASSFVLGALLACAAQPTTDVRQARLQMSSQVIKLAQRVIEDGG